MNRRAPWAGAAGSALCTRAGPCRQASSVCAHLPCVHLHPGLPSEPSPHGLHDPPLRRLMGPGLHNGQNHNPPLSLNSSLPHLAQSSATRPRAQTRQLHCPVRRYRLSQLPEPISKFSSFLLLDIEHLIIFLHLRCHPLSKPRTDRPCRPASSSPQQLPKGICKSSSLILSLPFMKCTLFLG